VFCNILHIINEPEKDFFPTVQQKDQWLTDQKHKFDELLRRYHDLLVEKDLLFLSKECILSFKTYYNNSRTSPRSSKN